MHRVAGIETEYGCLVSGPGGSDAWPQRARNHLFHQARLGAVDLHYRDYEEPPGNGGFLRNGGRLYLDMGHLEYASPECRTLRDMAACDLAGDLLAQHALDAMGAADRVAFVKNNIDHHTGATFGCHENYLMQRAMQFTPAVLGTLLSFLSTRQIFSGAGRVGQALHPMLEEAEPGAVRADFQLSQRADHIVNDIYQWVQFNRSIINARDEPLADHRKYRRLHLLIGDSNVSPFATALKVGTTDCLLTLLEMGGLPRDVILFDAVTSARQLSRSGDPRAAVELADGRTRGAIEVQRAFLACAEKNLAGRDEEMDWVLESWEAVLAGLESAPESLLGAVDWLSKKWMLDAFRESEGLAWDDPWLQSLDLEYHIVDPRRGLFHALDPAPLCAEWNAIIRREASMDTPPSDTRARGRGLAVSRLIEAGVPYVIDWDCVALAPEQALAMPDPFYDYVEEVDALLGSG